MKKTLAIFFFVITGYNCFAQGQQTAIPKFYAAKTTDPSYGLKKVQKAIKSDSATAYESLSLREKYTYNMIYGEVYSQICNMSPYFGRTNNKIYGFLFAPFFERAWSDRQRAFFKDNRDSVIALMTKDVRDRKEVGINFKNVIIDVNAVSMIPLLINTYKLQKEDRDILTVLMLLMNNNSYRPFTRSLVCKVVYGGTQSWYTASLQYNSSNEAFIIRRATDFYNGLGK